VSTLKTTLTTLTGSKFGDQLFVVVPAQQAIQMTILLRRSRIVQRLAD
jgi:hypothetical protein